MSTTSTNTNIHLHDDVPLVPTVTVHDNVIHKPFYTFKVHTVGSENTYFFYSKEQLESFIDLLKKLEIPDIQTEELSSAV